jgi:hypothetical protein
MHTEGERCTSLNGASIERLKPVDGSVDTKAPLATVENAKATVLLEASLSRLGLGLARKKATRMSRF